MDMDIEYKEYMYMEYMDSATMKLVDLLSIPSLEKWSINQLKFDGSFVGWNNLAGKGTIGCFTISDQDQSRDQKHWVTEPIKAECFTIGSLIFDCKYYCKCPHELINLCSLLALAHQWKIRQLHLIKMKADGWYALNKVVDRGEVLESVWVDEDGLRAANKQVISALWRATQDSGHWVFKNKILSKRRLGDAGLQTKFKI